jgi:hypothetical protein
MLSNRKLFGYSFPVWLAISLYIASRFDARPELLTFYDIALPTVSLLAASMFLSGLTACYLYPVQWYFLIYRAVMQRLASKRYVPDYLMP